MVFSLFYVITKSGQNLPKSQEKTCNVTTLIGSSVKDINFSPKNVDGTIDMDYLGYIYFLLL